MTHVVYWIRLQEHTDIKSQGYVGVSKDYSTRLRKHWFDSTCSGLHVHRAMNKYKEQIITSIVSEGDEEYCYALENLLRPNQNMAWNSAVGGDIAISRKGRVASESTREKIRLSSTGRKKTPEAIAKYAASMTGRNLWENSAANKSAWAKAVDFCAWAKINPKVSARKMAQNFGFENCNPWKLLEKIRSGWNPSQDTAYLSWLASYKNKLEATNA